MVRDVVWWPHSSSLNIASTRIRCINVASKLVSKGYNIHIGSPSGKKPSIVVLGKRYDARSLRMIEELIASFGTKIILDMCDNHFVQYSRESSGEYNNRVELLVSVLRLTDLVVVSSRTLEATFIENTPFPLNIRVIGDSVEESIQAGSGFLQVVYRQYLKLVYSQFKGYVRLVWFGSAGSDDAKGGVRDLAAITSRLNELSQKHHIVLTVISNSRELYKQASKEFRFPCMYFDWNRHLISSQLLSQNVSLIPIQKNEFTQCKSNNRVVFSLMHNLCVCATSIPSYQELSDYIVLDDWGEGLSKLVGDVSLGEKNVTRCKEYVLARWGVDVIAQDWAEAFKEVLA